MMRRISTLAATAAFVAAFGLAGVAKSNPPVECIALGLGAHPIPCHANLDALLSDEASVHGLLEEVVRRPIIKSTLVARSGGAYNRSAALPSSRTGHP